MPPKKEFWTEARDNLLIDLVKTKKVLWDIEEARKSSSDVKDQEWDNIGKDLKSGGEMAKERFKAMKIRFKNNLKRVQDSKKDKGATEYSPKWPLYSKLNFLTQAEKPEGKKRGLLEKAASPVPSGTSQLSGAHGSPLHWSTKSLGSPAQGSQSSQPESYHSNGPESPKKNIYYDEHLQICYNSPRPDSVDNNDVSQADADSQETSAFREGNSCSARKELPPSQILHSRSDSHPQTQSASSSSSFVPNGAKGMVKPLNGSSNTEATRSDLAKQEAVEGQDSRSLRHFIQYVLAKLQEMDESSRKKAVPAIFAALQTHSD